MTVESDVVLRRLERVSYWKLATAICFWRQIPRFSDGKKRHSLAATSISVRAQSRDRIFRRAPKKQPNKKKQQHAKSAQQVSAPCDFSMCPYGGARSSHPCGQVPRGADPVLCVCSSNPTGFQNLRDVTVLWHGWLKKLGRFSKRWRRRYFVFVSTANGAKELRHYGESAVLCVDLVGEWFLFMYVLMALV